MHKRQINKLAMAMATKGVTLVPLRVYFRKGKAKVELGLAKGKQAHDKRDTMRTKEAGREISREIARRLKGRG